MATGLRKMASSLRHSTWNDRNDGSQNGPQLIEATIRSNSKLVVDGLGIVPAFPVSGAGEQSRASQQNSKRSQRALLPRLIEKTRRSKDAPAPVDNFTIWDQQARAPSADAPVFCNAGADLRRNAFQGASTSDGHHKHSYGGSILGSEDDYYQSAEEYLEAPAPFSIKNIDWSQMNDAQAQDVFKSFNHIKLPELRGPPSELTIVVEPERSEFSRPSPVDSAKSFSEQPPQYTGKGKGRAVEIDPECDRRPKVPPKDSTADVRLNDIHLLESSLKQDLAQLQKIWESRLKEMQAKKIAELERQRQAEEEQRRLREIERRKVIKRQQEERDRRVARAMQLEEERECLRREEEEQKMALELQKQLEEEERAAAIRAAMRECIVCGDSKAPLEFAVQPITAACQHPPQTCIECVQSWLAAEFASKGCEGIICPECPATLQYDDLHRAASAETFEAYEKTLTRTALGQLDDFAWCLKSGCGSGQLNEDSNNFMDCASCHYKQCLLHRCAWHTGETCQQYEYRTSGRQREAEEKATEAMIDNISKKCPGPRCGWRIQKTDGCDHMTCRRCKHQFCWQCLAAHEEIKRIGNTAHKIDCKFHSDNLKPDWPFNVH